ncbi:hypothetical protein AB0C47_13505 [Micromonospora taraxaci]|uniref:hypothetical protein n=1 Tax=Micromonospora taraxaci TaxID=1316803 RepID=UPI0033E4A52E
MSLPHRDQPTVRRDAAGQARDFLDAARAVLTAHADVDGFCHGCRTDYHQLKPAPCEYARWARRSIAHHKPGKEDVPP